MLVWRGEYLFKYNFGYKTLDFIVNVILYALSINNLIIVYYLKQIINFSKC